MGTVKGAVTYRLARRLIFWSLRLSLSLCLLGRAFPAAAAPPAEDAAAREPADTKADEKAGKSSILGPIQEAQTRFNEGVTLYGKGDLKGALAKFQAAYAIDPVYRVLYNLGLVSYELKDWAGALNHYRDYLKDDRVAAARRVQVERVVLELAQRVGRLEIELRDGPADVEIDDQPIAPARLEAPLALNPGTHRVRVIYPKQAAQVRTLAVAGADEKRLVFERGVAVRSRAAAVAAKVDKDEVDQSQADQGQDDQDQVDEDEVILRRPHRPLQARSSRLSTYTWIATGALLASAGVVGYLAWQSSNQLVADRMHYPVDGVKLGNERLRTQMLSNAADGLLLGGALFAVVSAYLTWGLDDSGDGRGNAGRTIAAAEPGPSTTALQPMPAGSVSLAQVWKF